MIIFLLVRAIAAQLAIVRKIDIHAVFVVFGDRPVPHVLRVFDSVGIMNIGALQELIATALFRLHDVGVAVRGLEKQVRKNLAYILRIRRAKLLHPLPIFLLRYLLIEQVELFVP